jgi:peptidoglycan/LPS O-acetylase OafA/YrhL
MIFNVGSDRSNSYYMYFPVWYTAEREREREDALSISQGNSVKGIAALLLVVVHIREVLDVMPISYKILATGGYLFVSIFFFYSGYGITKKQRSDGNYVSERLPKRILYLLELTVGSEILYYCVYVAAFGREIELLDALKCITGITALNGALWTVTAMLIIQACIWMLEKVGFLRNYKYRYTVMSVIGVIAYIAITLLRGRRGAWEMQSCFAFSLGCLFAEAENQMRETAQKQKFLFAAVFVIAFIAPYISEFLLRKDVLIVRVVFGTLASLTFILLMVSILEQVKIGNRVTRYFGSMFTEIYIFHGIVLKVLKFYLPNLFNGNANLLASVISLAVVLLLTCGIKRVEDEVKQRR